MARLVLFNKPFGVLCQFTDRAKAVDGADPAEQASPGSPSAPRQTLADYITRHDVYPAGRLDFDSEGLVVLTDDGPMQARISDPRHKMVKRYVVQVSGVPAAAALDALCRGVLLRDGPARARSAAATDAITWPRTPEIRHPHATSWVAIELSEGRNRQVRRMLAAVGHPVLRLIRTHVGPWSVDHLAPGTFSETLLHVAVKPAQRSRPDRDRSARPGQTRERDTDRVNPSPPRSRPLTLDSPRGSTRSTAPKHRRGAPSSRKPRPS